MDDAYDNPGDERTASITHTVVAGTSDYGSVTVDPVSVTVADDDTAPSAITLTVDADTGTDGIQTSVAEGGGAKTVRVTATITGNSRFPVETTVTLAVGTSTDGAREGTDYETVADQTITIAAGASSGHVDFTLTPRQDVLHEGAETISLDGTSGTLDVTDASITLTDDDAAPTGVTLSVQPNTVGEGDATATTVTVTATVNGATRYTDAKTVTVSVGAGASTATSATDYAAVANFDITIAAGAASATGTFDLTPTQDTLHEGTETIDVTGASGTLDVTKAVISLTDDDTAPSFAVADASAAEGDAITFTVTRSGATGAAATVKWATADDSTEDAKQATAGDDYTAVTTARTLSFAVGDSAKTFTVATAEDTLAEGDETFLVKLSDATGATIATDEATGTITDDDTAPTALTLTVDADTGTEGVQDSIAEDGGAKTVRVTATLGGTSTFTTATTVTVAVGKSDDSATEATDYETVADQTITIPAGASSAHVDFDLTPKQDVLHEGVESISLDGSATGLTVTDTAISLTDDEGTPTATLVLTPATIDESGASNTSTVTATLNRASSKDLTLTVSAGAGVTLSANKVLTIDAGETASEGTVTLTAEDNDVDAADLEVAVSAVASGGHGVANPADQTLTITDDDTRGVTVSKTELTLAEADDAATDSTKENEEAYTVVLDSKPAAGTVTIAVASGDVKTATVSPPSLTFNTANWSIAQTVTVTAIADAVDNTDDERTATITHALTATGEGNDYGGVKVADIEVTVTDDDTATLSIADVTAAEGAAATFKVTLSAPSASQVTVTATTSEGSATDPEDYTHKTQALTFAAGDTSKDFTVAIASDTVVELDETFTVTLSGATGAAIADGTATGTITGAKSLLSIGDASAAEGGTLSFTVTRTGATSAAATVQWRTADDTATDAKQATAGTDYRGQATAAMLSFKAGEASATITVATIEDAIDEPDETFVVTLSSPSTGVAIVDATGTGTITDDDDAPDGIELSANPASVAENAATAATVTVTATVTGGTTYGSETTVTVTVGDTDDTATSGEDYAAVSSFDIDIPAGATSATATFSLDPTDDAIAEGSETLTVSGASGDIDVESAEVTLTDDEGTPTATLVLTPATIDESGASNSSTVTATLNRASSKDLTLTVSAGTGVTLSANKVLTVAAGETASEGTVTLTAIDNALDAPDLEVTVSATASGGRGVANPAGRTLTIRDDDTRGVTVSPTSLTVRETDDSSTNGNNENEETYTVVLDSEPAAGTVTVAVTSGDTKAATVSPARLTFNTTNWRTAQTVTVTGVDDDTDNTDDKRTVSVSHAVSTTGTGNDYAALESADPVTVTVTDDDAAPGGISLSVDTPSLGEGADATEVTVTATVTGTIRFAEAQTVAVSIGGGTATSATDYEAVAAFNVTILAMATTGSATFTLTPIDDDVDETNETIDVTGALAGVTVTKATISLTDDDTRGVTVTGSPLTIDEADDSQTDAKENEGSYTVVLDSRPTSTVVINLSAGASAPVTLDKTSLTFAPDDWNTAQTVTVTAVDDAYDNAGDERTASITHTVVAGTSDYGSVTVDPVSVTVADDDTAPSAITLTVDADTGTDGIQTSVAEGGGAKTVRVTATLAGASRFPAAKTVVLAVGKATDSAKEGTDYTEVGAVSITIDANAASGSATFTLTPINDTIDDDAESLTIDGSVTGESGVTVSPVSIAIDDNDGAPTGIALSVNPSTVAENAATAATITVTATVTGGTAYDTETTVTVTVGDADDTAVSDTDYAEVADFDIDIPAGAASATATFSLDPTDDAIAEGSETLTVSGASGEIDVESAEVTLTDDEVTPTPTLVLTPATIDESGASNSSTVTATLSPASSKDLTLTVSAGAGVTLSANKALTIDAGETASEGVVTLTAEDNDVDAADLAVTVSAVASGGNGVANPANQTLTITDDDARGVTVSKASLSVRETDDGTTNGNNESEETYTVVLDSEPAAGTVTVAVTSGDTKAATVSPARLTFNTANWRTAQTVTVTGVDDDTDNTDDKRTVSVTHAVSTTGTGNDYAALASADPVEVTVTDDDAAPGGISLSVDTPSLGEGADATEVTVTATVTGATRFAEAQTVAVSVGSGTATSGTDYEAVAAFNVTIPAMAVSGSATFTLTPIDDDVDETNETIDITGSLAGVTVTKATISLTDDDTRGVTVTGSPLTIDEADDAQTDAKENEGSYTVVLDSRPTSTVVINLSAGASAPVTLDKTSLTFAPDDWNTAQTVTVTAVDDAYDNPGDERAASITHTVVAGTSDYGGVTATPVSVTVNDDDTAPSAITLTVDADTGTDGIQTSVAEGGGAKTVRVTATITGTSRFPVETTVTLAVGTSTDGAREGTDYETVADQTITIAAGASSGHVDFTLTPRQDVLHEGAETISLDGTSGTLDVTDAAITLTDDDAAPTGVTLSVQPNTVGEGDATATTVTVTATVNGATRYTDAKTVTVSVGGGASTATSATDYAAVANFDITIAAGEASATGTFDLTPTQDTLHEGTETIDVTGASGTLDVTKAVISLTDDDTAPSFAVADASAAEGDAITFTVTRSGATGAAATVKWATADDAADDASPATAGTDYTAVTTARTLSFAVGDSAKTFTVATTEDTLAEGDETFLVELSDATGGATITTDEATGTITDDDTAPTALTLTVDADTGTEGVQDSLAEDGGAKTVRVTATLGGTSTFTTATTVTVKVGTSDDSATEATDYETVADQTITIPAGASSAYVDFDLTPKQDVLHEGVESISLDGSATGLTVTDTAISLTDDEGTPTATLVLTPATIDESGASNTSTVTATLNRASSKDLTLTVSAGAGVTLSANKVLTIDAGETASEGTVTLTAEDNDVDAADLEVAVSAVASGGHGVANPADQTLTITDDDTRGVTVSKTELTLAEADDAATDSTKENEEAYTVVLDSKPAAGTVTIAVASGDVKTATVSPPSLTFNTANWSIAQTVTVTAIADAVDNTDDERTATITHALTATGEGNDYGGVKVADIEVTVTDDDTATLSIADVTAAEGAAATFKVTLSAPSASQVTVTATTSEGSATDPEDYTHKTQALTFAAGDTSKDFTVAIASDTVVELDETFTVTLSGATGAAIADGTATGTITGAKSLLSIGDASAAEGGTLSFTVTRTGATSAAATVQWRTADDTATDAKQATAGTDYRGQATAAMLSFKAGEASATITVATIEDAIDEPDETFVVTLSSPSTGVAIVDATGTGTITDDDDAPDGIELSANPASVAENAATAATVTVTATVTGGTTYGSETTVTVTVGDTDDTATSGEDYAAVSSFDIDIPAGATSATATFSLDPTDDAIAEGSETLTVSGASGDIDVESAEVTLTDDEGTPTATLVLTPATIDESGASNSSTVTATLNRASSKDLTLTVSAGTGVTLSANKVLTVAAGETASEGTVTLTAIDNALDAPDLEVTVSATASGGRGVANPAGRTLTIRDDDTRGVTVSPTSLTVRETDDSSTNGNNENEETYTVVLDSEPAAGTVTVAVTSGDTKAATVSPARLTFNTTNWRTAQTVTVTGVDDDTDNTDDKRTVSVSHAVSTTGTGNDYAALESADPVTVTVTDDDAAPGGISLSVDTPSLGEGADATEVTVTATVTGTIRFAEAQTVAVSIGGGTATSATDYEAVAAFNVTILAMATTGSATFTLTPIDDDVDETNETIDVTGALAGVTVTKATISLTDDDTRGVTVTGSPLTIDEADDSQTDAKENEGSYTVVLDSRPTSTVVINLSAGASAPVTLDKTSLTFAPDDWNTAQTVTVTAVDDAYDNAGDERTASITHTVVAGTSDYGSVTVDPVSVTVADDDTAPSAITLTVDADTGTDGIQTSVAEGGGAKTVRVTATLAGASRFPAAKTVVLAVGKATDSAKEGTDYTEVGAVSITIDANAASGSATFTLTPINDTIDDDAESLTIDGSVTGESGVTVSPVSIAIDDNDGAPTGIALSVNPSTVAENAATAATITVTATVTGGTAYDTETTVTVTVGDADDTAVSDTDYAEVADFDIDIPAGAASATATFSLDPTDDAIAEGSETLTVSGASGEIDVESAEVTLTDDEVTPTPTLVLTPATIDESGASNSSTVTATLSPASSKDLTLTVSAGAGVTLSANKALTIDAGETASEGVVTLTAEDNDVDAADLAVTVSAVASGGNGVANPANQTLTITDDDARGVTVSKASLSVRETDDGTTNGNNESEETYTVVLDSEPAAGTVTVAVTSGDTKAATVSPARLTFNTANWRTAQTVTVTGVDDDTDNTDDKRTVSVTHAVSTTGTGNDYAALASADPVEVTVTDDDAAPGGISLSVDTPSLGEGADATEVTVTATVTGATRFAEAQTVAVSVGSGTATSGTDYEAVAAFNVTIPAMAVSGSATFTLTPIDDDVDETNETIDITGSLAGVTVTKATISLTDDDTRGVTVTGSPLTIDEADDAQTDAKENEGSYTVVLDSRPTSTVVINLSAGASAPVTLDKTSLTFAPDDWNTAQTVTVTAVDDAYDNPGDERAASITHTVVAGTSDYGGVTATPVSVTVNDDDTAPSAITLTVDADTGTDGIRPRWPKAAGRRPCG